MNKHTEIVESARKFIELNIEKGVSPDETAGATNYSLKQLNRVFSMITGLTLGEYIRWNKLTRALFDLKYSDTPIIDIAHKYGYESQEGFTRAFKDNFSINPGVYRKTKQQVTAKNWHINQFIHQAAHDALNKGVYKRENVESWIIVKPDRIWASARRNIENLPVSAFYDICGLEGLMNRTGMLPNVIFEGGAYLPKNQVNQLCFGVEVEADYPLDLLSEFEIIHIPQSKYVVFNCPKYPIENHGDVIHSTWSAQKDYDIKAQGLKWDYINAPIFEQDNEETGYTLLFPVTELVAGE